MFFLRNLPFVEGREEDCMSDYVIKKIQVAMSYPERNSRAEERKGCKKGQCSAVFREG